jgi:hypothetical protein
MTRCEIHDAGSVELFFYDELSVSERASVEWHIRGCRVCQTALEELQVIRTALATRPVVRGPASGDWSAFMERLDRAVRLQPQAPVVVPFTAAPPVVRHQFVGLLATAALLTVVAIGVFFASQASRRAIDPGETLPTAIAGGVLEEASPIQTGLASVGARHLERSKLVILGLATREPGEAATSNWAYERELATSLLNDTRLYRMAAEERGLTSLAGVMRDLELVLLQTSMAEAGDETALPQIQRLIRKRGLVQKMDAVGTTGLVP